MKSIYALLLLVLITFTSCISVKADIYEDSSRKYIDHNEAEAGIRLVMEQQEKAWNDHDLEGFMQGYWKNDSLKFFGGRGLTYGWDNTLANYKKSYATKAESGTLNFVVKDISKIENGNYWVMGEYHLTRTAGKAQGVFMIIFKKINGEWKIVADMSC